MPAEELRTALLISIYLVCSSLYMVIHYMYLSLRLQGCGTFVVCFVVVAVPVFLITGVALPDFTYLWGWRLIASVGMGIGSIVGLRRSRVLMQRSNPRNVTWSYTEQEEVGSWRWQLMNIASSFLIGGFVGAFFMHMAHPQSNFLAWGLGMGAGTAVIGVGLLNILARKLSPRPPQSSRS